VSTGRYIARGRERAAVCTCGGAQGITLLELLVVLAILGLMAAVAIPTFARFGFFSRNETQQGARELYKVLSAARVLAASNRVKTAMAYAFTYKSDSLTGQSTKTIESYAVVQKLPQGYQLIVKGTKETDDDVLDHAFVPVTEMRDGASIFRAMPPDTALLAAESYGNGDDKEENGLYYSLIAEESYIRIYPGEYTYDEAERCWSFRSDDGPLTTEPGGEDTDFPAHVFTPSGRMEWSQSGKERCKIHVAYPPDADPVERFVKPESVDPQNIKLSDFRTIDLELYRGTGRVQIVREES
jgi:prepilin-type N-terminal cleavage/methylation domain-containing protein